MKPKGFSLIELLVTLSIIGILAGIATTFYGRYQKEARKIAVKSEMTRLMGVVRLAKEADGFYHQFIYQMGYRPQGKVFGVIGTGKVTPIKNCCEDYYPDLGKADCTWSPNDGPERELIINAGERCPLGTKNGSSGEFVGGVCNDGHCSCVRQGEFVKSFDHYNCKNTAPHNAVTNIDICHSTTLCEFPSELKGWKPTITQGSPPTITPPAPPIDPEIPSFNTADFDGCYDPPLDTWCDCETITLAGASPLFEGEKLALSIGATTEKAGNAKTEIGSLFCETED